MTRVLPLKQRQKIFYKRLKIVEKRTNENIEPITPFISNNKRMKFKCMNCGTKFTKLPISIINNSLGICPNRIKRIKLKKRQETFHEKLLNEEKQTHELNNIEQLTPYINNHTYIKFKCNKCGKIFKKYPCNLLKNSIGICPNKIRKYYFKIHNSRFYKRLIKREKQTGEYGHIKRLTPHQGNRPIKFKCLDCKLISIRRPEDIFKASYICKHKSKLVRYKKASNSESKMSLRWVRNKVYRQVGNKFLVISIIKNNHKLSRRSIILFEHKSKQCIYYRKHHQFGTFKKSLRNFLRSKCKCVYCANYEKFHRLLKSTKEFKKEVYNQVGDKYKVKSVYKNSVTPIIFEHYSKDCIYYRKHHKYYLFKRKPSNFLMNPTCPKDRKYKAISQKTMTQKDFEKLVYKQTHGEYKVKGKYINYETPVMMEHHSKFCQYYKKHHKYYEWRILPGNFLGQHCRCPEDKGYKLSKAFRMTISQFKHRVFKLAGNNFKVLQNYYINNHTKILMEHTSKKCPFFKKYNKFYKFKVRPGQFLEEPKCPYDKISYGEICVMNWLIRKGLVLNKDFDYGYICKHHPYTELNQHFDFYLPKIKYNKYFIHVAIEFDGQQHFKPVPFSKNEPKWQLHIDYVNLHYRDIVKEFYGVDHRIKLLRIENTNGYSKKRLKKFVNKALDLKLLPILSRNSRSINHFK